MSEINGWRKINISKNSRGLSTGMRLTVTRKKEKYKNYGKVNFNTNASKFIKKNYSDKDGAIVLDLILSNDGRSIGICKGTTFICRYLRESMLQINSVSLVEELYKRFNSSQSFTLKERDNGVLELVLEDAEG